MTLHINAVQFCFEEMISMSLSMLPEVDYFVPTLLYPRIDTDCPQDQEESLSLGMLATKTVSVGFG